MFDENTLTQFLSRFSHEKQCKMMEVYVTSLNKHMENCRQAAESKNAQKLKNAVHDLKSLCLTIGADDTGNRAAQMEKHIAEKQEAKAFEQMDELAEQTKHIINVINQKRQQDA